MIFSTLSSYSLLLMGILCLLGLCVGSFLNVLIDRLPNEEGIGGRSYCDYCKRKLNAIDLIPVLSFLYLGGKCRTCHKKLSIQYPIIELITGLIFVFVGIYFGANVTGVQLLAYFFLASVCVVIVMADAKYHIIPDSMTAIFILSALIISFENDILLRLGGGVVLFFILWLIYFVTRGKMMGFGDVKLAFGIGVLFGIVNGLLAIYLAFLTGGIFSIFLLLSGKSKLKSKIAFGPFMIAGVVLMLVFGGQVYLIIGNLFR